MRRFSRALLALSALAFGFAQGEARADALADIKAKGELVVGSKADYVPYGYRDSSGQIVGIEPDLAADVAKRLGVKLRIEPVVSSNRMQFLQQGKIDLMIATMNITPERAKAVGIVEPAYYASGVAAMANKKANIKTVADLKGKQVCAIQGAFYNSDIQSKFVQTNLVAFKGVPEAEQALLNGECIAFVYDDTLMLSKKKFEADKWKNFDVVMIPEIEPLPWGIAVKLEERDGPWGKFISETVADWHKKGTLLAIEKKWLGTNTKWLDDAHKKAK
jgi:polar amino acid transport system substrate-binding protein